MEINYTFPIGYIHPFPIRNIPDGWTALDGKNGTPDLSDRVCTIQLGHGPASIYPNSIFCMKNWEIFHKENPEWRI